MPSFARIHELFAVTPFMQDLGVAVSAVEPGMCETTLTIAPRHLQQNGYVHAGVSAAMADHTSGGAAGTLLDEGLGVLTTEYSIHFLRAAKGTTLRCRATVLKPGKRLSVVEAEIFCDDALVAKMTATMAIVPFVAPAELDRLA
jgi:uncharacterized protein (TIGR00369 family)